MSHRGEGEDLSGVPREHREAAEAVRAHLVSVRGGAVFLSPADALKLVGWLDDEVPVPDILRAIERAAEYRSKSRSRLPLGLGRVARHLGRPTRGAFGGTAPKLSDGLHPLLALIAERAAGDPLEALLTDLARQLAALPSDPRHAERAMTCIADFHQRVFMALPAARRSALRERARTGMGDLVHLLDERQLLAILEENARYAAREGYAWLSAATVWELLATEDC